VITEEQVQQAEADAERAQEVSAAADKAFVKGAGTTQAFEEQQDAHRRAEQAAKRLERLRAEYEMQEVLRAARRDLMAEATQEMAPAFRKLGESREVAVEALAGAQGAIQKALGAVGAYDLSVQEVARELVNRGLRGEDGEEVGGLLDGSVRVAGEQWNSVDVSGLLLMVLAECVKAAGGQHRLGVVPQVSYVGLPQQRGTREFLDRLVVMRG